MEDDLAFGNRLIQRRGIEHATLGERDSIAEWRQARSVAGREVIDDVDLVTLSQQTADQVVTDKPRTPGDQYPHACASTGSFSHRRPRFRTVGEARVRA